MDTIHLSDSLVLILSILTLHIHMNVCNVCTVYVLAFISETTGQLAVMTSHAIILDCCSWSQERKSFDDSYRGGLQVHT